MRWWGRKDELQSPGTAGPCASRCRCAPGVRREGRPVGGEAEGGPVPVRRAAAADRLPPPSPPSSQGERETGPTHVIRRRGTQTLPGVSDLSSRGRGGA